MPDEKELLKVPNTKRRIIFTIISWVFIILLAVLLILGLFFQTPWKVIVLLGIFLASLTVLPRPFRKWFWGCVGLTAIALVVWIFLPDNNEGWRPYTFDDDVAALNARYAVPDEENSAIIYDRLFTDYDPNRFSPSFLSKDSETQVIQNPWNSQDYPALANWLEDQSEIISTLLIAAEIEHCFFPISADPFLEREMDRHSAMRKWARLLVISGNNDIGQGRHQDGFDKYIAALKLGNHACRQVTLIDTLVGMAIEALGVSQINMFMVQEEPYEEQLNQIDKALKEVKHDWSLDFPKFFEYDKLYLKNLFGMFYQINQDGKIRLSRDPTEAMRISCPDDFSEFEYWKKKLFKINSIVFWFYLPSTPQELGRIIDDAFEKAAAKSEKELADSKTISISSYKLNIRYTAQLIADMSFSSSNSNIQELYLNEMTKTQGSRLLVALRRFKNNTGKWPEKLDEIKSYTDPELLADPAIIDSFVYRTTDDNFKLYSKGQNGIDEDGKSESKFDPNTSQYTQIYDDILIWPPKSCQENDPND